MRRLNDVEVNDFVRACRAGRTLVDLARELGIHPRTVAARLDTRAIARRVNRRKMSDHDVCEAACRYRRGDSLATVALTFNVDPATVLANSAVQESPSDPDLDGFESEQSPIPGRSTGSKSGTLARFEGGPCPL